MNFDPVVSLRIINNERLRRSLGWAEYRDLGGALALTSDAPIPDLNCIESFATDERHIESLLDIGFALLRAFDQASAAFVTPLDRPASLAEHLVRRGLAIRERSVSMLFRGVASAVRTSPDVRVRRAEPSDAATFANIVAAGAEKWARRLMLSSTLGSMLEPGHTFYVGEIDGQPAGTVHLLRDGGTAGIYAVATLKAYRRRGVSSTLIARAVRDAQAAGCDVIGLRTDAHGDARRLFSALGFEPAHESALWVERGEPGTPRV